MSRPRPLVFVAAMVGATALVAAAFSAAAETPPAGTAEPTTSTTGGPATTASPNPTLLPGSTTTTSSAVHPAPTTTSTTAPDVPVAGDATAPPGAPMVVPPEFWPLINSVHRTPGHSTAPLLTALRPLLDLGLTQDQVVAVGFGRFPVGGQATYSDDWWTPRFTPVFHLHQGNDIFAASGTPIRAPADGVLRQANEAVGGLSDYLTLPDGTYFYMAHLSAFVTGQKSGQKVKAGDVIGFVGATGDAVGGAPHCHFEIHPKGGAATDPKSTLDAWLTDDLNAAPGILAAYEGSRPQALLATALTRRTADGGESLFGAPSLPPRSQLLWASSASPGGALHLAEAAAVDAAADVDWPTVAAQQAAQAQTNLITTALIAPLTPAPLRALLGP